MIKTGMLYTAVLVGVYLLVSHATDAGKVITATSSGYAQGVKVLQGRG